MKARFAGLLDAVWAQRSCRLFTKVTTAPPSGIISSITPITELFPKFWYTYVDGADGAIIELNTSSNHKPPSREPRFIRDVQIRPGDAGIEGPQSVRISQGTCRGPRRIGVENLADALEKLRKEGVTVTDEIRPSAGGKIMFAFIEGPDQIRIELVEGQARKE